MHSLLLGRVYLAIGLLMQDAAGNRAEAVALLRQSLADARQLRIPEAGQIEGILRQHGEEP